MFYSLPFLITAIIFLFFGYLTIQKTKNIKVNFIFILFTISTVWWQSFQFLIQQSNGEILEWSLKLQYLGIIFIPILLYHFILLVIKDNSNYNKYILYMGYIISTIFFIVVIFTNKIINGFYNYFWGVHPKAAEWHPFFITYVVLFVSLFIFNLFKKYQQAKIFEQRKQYFYFLVAVIFYSISAVNFIPNYGIEIYPFGVFSLWFFIAFIFYAIVKYNLISTKAILNYSFVIFILSITSYIFWLTVLITEYYYIRVNFFEKSIILNMIIMPVFVYISIKIYKKVRKLAYNIFENFNKQEQIYKFITEIGEQNSSEKAIKYILEKMPLILKSDAAFIFNQNEKYEIISGVNFDAEIKKENLSDFYLRDRKLTRIEELNLKAVFPDSKNSITRDLMNQYDIAVLMHLNENISFLLQKKDNGNIFYQEEIEFLEEINNIILKKII